MPTPVEVVVVAVLMFVGAVFWLWRCDASKERALNAALEVEGEHLESALRRKDESQRLAESEEAGARRVRERALEAQALLTARRARADGAVRQLEITIISREKEVSLFEIIWGLWRKQP